MIRVTPHSFYNIHKQTKPSKKEFIDESLNSPPAAIITTTREKLSTSQKTEHSFNSKQMNQ